MSVGERGLNINIPTGAVLQRGPSSDSDPIDIINNISANVNVGNQNLDISAIALTLENNERFYRLLSASIVEKVQTLLNEARLGIRKPADLQTELEGILFGSRSVKEENQC